MKHKESEKAPESLQERWVRNNLKCRWLLARLSDEWQALAVLMEGAGFTRSRGRRLLQEMEAIAVVETTPDVYRARGYGRNLYRLTYRGQAYKREVLK